MITSFIRDQARTMKLQHLITVDRIRLDIKVETPEMAIEYMVSVLAEIKAI